MPEPGIDPPFITHREPLAVCPYDGLVPWQQDEDGPYCVHCHEPVTLPSEP